MRLRRTSELIIEYWSNGESVKLINTEDPATALEHYYEAERAMSLEPDKHTTLPSSKLWRGSPRLTA